MGDLDKIKAGPCKITLDTTEIGHTERGISLNITPIMRERKVDEFGETVVDLVHQGDTFEVTVTIAEWVLANFKAAFAPALDGTTYMSVGRKPGFSYRSVAKKLTIHPLEVVGTTEDVILYKAVAISPVAIGYNSDDDRVFEIVFKALPDTTRGDGNLLGQIGIPA